MEPDLFVGSHLLTTQKPASECYVIEGLSQRLRSGLIIMHCLI